MQIFQIQAITPSQSKLLRKVFLTRWGSDLMVSRGQTHTLSALPGFVAMVEGEVAGVATFKENVEDVELVSLDSWLPNHGIGSALLQAIVRYAHSKHKRLWLVTTNDNLPALKFYQKRQWKIKAIHLYAVSQARRREPDIPLTGYEGIPILHEIELEYQP